MDKLINTYPQNPKTNEIILNLRNGNPNYLTFIYDSIFPACAKFIKSNNGSLNDAKDVFQEALIILYKNVQKVSFELTSSLSTYLFAIVRNLWLKQIVRSKRKGQIINFEEYGVGLLSKTSHEKMIEEDGKAYKHRALNLVIQNLKEDAKYIITNYYFEKKSLKLIAKEMGYSEAYIRVKKNRVMDKLRQALLNKKIAA